MGGEMNHDEIIAMALEEGLSFVPDANSPLVRIVRKAVAKEREAWRASLEPAFRGRMGSEQVREIVQSAIRTRGTKEGA